MNEVQKNGYIHPQETWSEEECKKRSRSAPANHFKDKPPIGLINSSSSTYPGYGQSTRYNGGCVRNGEWYQYEEIPFPIIPTTYEFVNLPSWGTRIQKKAS